MKKIALFGGSFNPPHNGHFEVGKFIHESLKVDEVWFLFSVNWQKDANKYASTEHRMEMGRIMAKHYPDMPFVMTDIQEQLGTHITHQVLSKLQEKFPDDRFVWVMGADNLLTFDTWEHYEDILENFPIAVMSREPYTTQALQSAAALSYRHLKLEDASALSDSRNGWAVLDNFPSDLSSSGLLTRLRQGETDFGGGFQEVSAYIRAHKLYGVGQPEPQPHPAQGNTLDHP